MIALGVTLLAHIWSGWIWTWIHELNQPVPNAQFVQIYPKPILPSIYQAMSGIIMVEFSAAQTAGIPVGTATLSVLLEPVINGCGCIVVLIGVQPISNSRCHTTTLTYHWFGIRVNSGSSLIFKRAIHFL